MINQRSSAANDSTTRLGTGHVPWARRLLYYHRSSTWQTPLTMNPLGVSGGWICIATPVRGSHQVGKHDDTEHSLSSNSKFCFAPVMNEPHPSHAITKAQCNSSCHVSAQLYPKVYRACGLPEEVHMWASLWCFSNDRVVHHPSTVDVLTLPCFVVGHYCVGGWKCPLVRFSSRWCVFHLNK